MHSEPNVPSSVFRRGWGAPMRIILALAALTACFSVWDRFANDGTYSAALRQNILGAALPG
ncbi:hypothetical protein MPLB_1080118 [Mesorhizobium sp. ORS 3324]|nr:hypothetical protein MPLB_1080118 [Mesorhizobium sp. ORS 3324]